MVGSRTLPSWPPGVLFRAASQEIGGGNRSLLLLAAALRNRGGTVMIASPAPGRLEEECVRAALPCRVVLSGQPSLRNVVGSIRDAVRWRSLVLETGAAVLHANSLASGREAALGARAAGVPLVCHVRFPVPESYVRWAFRALPQPKAIVFNSEALFDESRESFARYLPHAHLAVIHNAVDLESFRPLHRTSARPRVGIIANLTPVKGHLDFLEMAHQLVPRWDVEFWIVGDDIQGGSWKSHLERRTQELGLTGRVRFLGYRADIPSVLAELDVLVCCSHVEPFGRVLAEAMSCKVPVVATRVGGIPEVVEDGLTGLLVPSRSANLLADAVASLLADAPRRARMGEAGRERAARWFGVDAHVERVLSVYASVLGAPQSPAE